LLQILYKMPNGEQARADASFKQEMSMSR
ncbi:hypothetical protein BAE44_0003484, partial [Dichanthelium oligosanthes]